MLPSHDHGPQAYVPLRASPGTAQLVHVFALKPHAEGGAMRYWPRRAAVRATVLAYLSMLVWACTESTAPHEPSGRAPLIPSFASSTWWAEQNIIEVCRYFGPPGPALTWTGEGSSWAGACPVQPIATPSQTMGSATPGPVTFTFQEPVRRIGMRYLCEYSSQCTPVQFEAYDANNQLVASGTWVPDG